MSDAPAAAPPAPSGSPGALAPGAQPNATPGQKPGETPAQAEARRLKLRLGDKDVELDESEVVANYEKGRNADRLLSKASERRQEALRAKAEAEGLLTKLKKDPRAALRELGVDVRKLSEATILEEMEIEQMTPEQRRAYDAEQKLKEYEAEKQRAEEEKQQAVHQEEVQRHQEEFSNLFLETMEKAGLPRGSARFVAYRMAHLYAQNEAAGLESTPEEMAAHVLQGVQAEHRGVLSGLRGKPLLDYLGPEAVREVLAAHLEGVRARRGAVAAPPPQPRQQATQPAPAKPSRNGRWDQIEALIAGK